MVPWKQGSAEEGCATVFQDGITAAWNCVSFLLADVGDDVLRRGLGRNELTFGHHPIKSPSEKTIDRAVKPARGGHVP